MWYQDGRARWSSRAACPFRAEVRVTHACRAMWVLCVYETERHMSAHDNIVGDEWWRWECMCAGVKCVGGTHRVMCAGVKWVAQFLLFMSSFVVHLKDHNHIASDVYWPLERYFFDCEYIYMLLENGKLALEMQGAEWRDTSADSRLFMLTLEQ